jgi:hypothetical protein
MEELKKMPLDEQHSEEAARCLQDGWRRKVP